MDPDDFVDDLRAARRAATTVQSQTRADSPYGHLVTSGVIDYTTDPISLSMNWRYFSARRPTELEVRVVDGVVYSNRVGAKARPKFSALDISDGAIPSEVRMFLAQVDPLAMIEVLEPAVTAVTYSGGAEATDQGLEHSELTVATAQLRSLLGVPLDEYEMPEEIEVALWVDDDFRLRQLVMTVEGSDAFDIRITTYGWNLPADIEAPPSYPVARPPAAIG